MGEAVITCTVSPCTVNLVIQDSLWASFDPATALQVAAAIAGAWAVGFAFRAVIRVIRDGDSTVEES